MDVFEPVREPVVVPEPEGVLAEPWSPGKVWRLGALFGPAAIVASVSIGAGETIVVVKTGSWAGYNLAVARTGQYAHQRRVRDVSAGALLGR